MDPRMLEEQDENEDGIEIRDRFEMADHRMAKQEYTQTHKISKSASSHVLKVKNIKKGPRTRYDSHMSTDGGYTTGLLTNKPISGLLFTSREAVGYVLV